MKVLGIFAHPDDEVIWGWPVMQDASIERYLITISDNHPGYDSAGTALEEVCKTTGIHFVECMILPSEFYRLPTRYEQFTLPMLIERIIQTIKKALFEISPDYIITHNPFGEYGHGDHRLVFNIIISFIDKIGIVFTDACQSNKCHLSFDEIPIRIWEAYFLDEIGRYELDKSWLDICSSIYKKHKAWSWDLPHVVPESSRLFRIE